MYNIGTFALFVGGLVIVVSGVVWAFASFDALAKKLALFGGLAISLGLILVASLGPVGDQSMPPSAAAESQPKPAKYDLRLRSWHCTTENGYHQIDGEIQNISDRPIDQVTIYATFKGNNDEVIKTASALIDYQPIMPGQTSPFKVLTTANPLVRRCFISVGTLFGGSLSWQH